MRRSGDKAIDRRHVRYVADHIPGARYVEFPGSDNLPFAGDSESVMGELEEFFTGARTHVEPGRALATVVFTDVCGSTATAAQMGDRAWREVLAEHDRRVRSGVERHSGRLVKTSVTASSRPSTARLARSAPAARSPRTSPVSGSRSGSGCTRASAR